MYELDDLYFQLGVVAFNTSAITPDGCFSDGLTLATGTALKYLTESFLQLLQPKGKKKRSHGQY